jgi:hypothetical protein
MPDFITMIGCQGFVLHPQGNIRRLSIQQDEKETSVLQGQDLAHVRLPLVTLKVSLILLNLIIFVFFISRGCLDMDNYNFDKVTDLRTLNT